VYEVVLGGGVLRGCRTTQSTAEKGRWRLATCTLHRMEHHGVFNSACGLPENSDFKVLVAGPGTRAPAHPLPGAVGHAEAKGLLNSDENRWGIIVGQIPTIEALELEPKVLDEGPANDDD
jgi:hypothetical protein